MLHSAAAAAAFLTMRDAVGGDEKKANEKKKIGVITSRAGAKREKARPTSQGPGLNNHRLSRPLSASIEHLKSANLELSEFCAVRSLPLPPFALCPKTARDGGRKKNPPPLSPSEKA